MDATALAEAIADCHAIRARAQRQGAVASVLLALLAGGAGFVAGGRASHALAMAMAVALIVLVPFALRRLLAARRLARLERDHPALFPTALERYRMVMATERASRYKLYC